MVMRTSALFLSALAAIATAQQFAGDFIPNKLPVQAGANISFFNVRDALGGRTTMINYYSTPNGKVQDQKKVQRAIIVLVGAIRNSGDYFTTVREQIPAAAALNPQVSEDTVAIMAPMFANELDSNVAYPVTDGVSTSNALVWSGLDWISGSTNIYPARQKSVSTYEALDQAIQWFSNRINFPNLKQIVVVGHSAGGQMAQRYAVVGAPLDLSVPITYYVGNPNSFAWLNSTRPNSTASCPTYDKWSGGLAEYGSGNYTYNALLGAPIADPVLMRANYALKHIAYARGLLDDGNFSQADCSAIPQGDDRGTRFTNFLTYFKPTKLDTVDYVPNARHSNEDMFGSLAGLTRLFLDNWDGSGKRAPDFGPRQVPGDDPHPVSAGNWTSF